VVLQLPATWGARTQTLILGGSTDGTAFTSLKSSGAYTFDPNTKNTVTLTFPAVTQRYFRVTSTARDQHRQQRLARGRGLRIPDLGLLTPPSPRCRRTLRPAAPPCVRPARPGAGRSLETTH
jgi:hypothetical protein